MNAIYCLPDDSVSLLGRLEDLSLPVWLLMSWMVVLGTIVPFALLAASLQSCVTIVALPQAGNFLR